MSNFYSGGENENLVFRSWIAGFIDGEGCLYVRANNTGAYSCCLTVELRGDDSAILHRIRNELGIGRVEVRQSPSRNRPMAYWHVTKKADALTLSRFFDSFPLQTKKRRDMLLWQESVRLHQMVRRGRDNKELIEQIRACKRSLEEGRSKTS